MYDLKKCNVLINNEMVVGLGAGTPINVEYASDRVNKYTGAKGETAFAITNDDSGTLTLTLMQSSNTNKVLHQLDKQEFSVTFVDSNDEGAIKATCTKCMIQTYAPNGRGTEITEREWVIALPALVYQL